MALDTTFLNALASKEPTPGGGGASAYVGALASALSSMVGNLTVGKKTYAAVEPQVIEHMEVLEAKRARLLELVDADAEAFTPLSNAYRMPSATEEEKQAKDAALQAALLDACLIPLEIMKVCGEVVEEADFLAHNGSKLAVSDAGASAVLARAAVYSASLNVYINTGSMNDKEQAERLNAQADEIIANADAKADAVFAFVMGKIRA